ncbi:MAG: methionyl-tRNA formyltransferase, partial [Peptococcaceae bacterium]|nr:methionyl-tRNA formyltransferase [Peptococcaceae bacterium]
MRIVFMGTPDFAVQSLNALTEAGHDVAAVITQPDRPKGRGNKMAFPEVKTRALELNLPVHQPASVKDEAFLELLKGYAPDVIVVVAFGRILPQAVLELPQYGCINVHGSLLPKYRGAAPIQRAVLDGCKESGVTIMQMDIGMDTGDMLLQGSLPITDEDNTGTMFEKLAVLGGELLIQTLDGLKQGTIQPVKQNEAEATHAARILKEDEVIDWTKPADVIFCQIRGLAPAPGAYTMWNDQRLKIWKSRVNPKETGKAPGTLVEIGKDYLLVQT